MEIFRHLPSQFLFRTYSGPDINVIVSNAIIWFQCARKFDRLEIFPPNAALVHSSKRRSQPSVWKIFQDQLASADICTINFITKFSLISVPTYCIPLLMKFMNIVRIIAKYFSYHLQNTYIGQLNSTKSSLLWSQHRHMIG